MIKKARITQTQSEEDSYTDQLGEVARNIRTYRLPIQTVQEDDYEQVAEIFNRVNTGGRRLSKGDLVMGALAARWTGGRRRIEDFELGLSREGWRFNREVLLRIMSAIAVDSANHIRLFEMRDAEKWELNWGLAETAIKHTMAFFSSDCEVPNIRLLPSEYLAIVPALVMHKRGGALKPGESDALRRWVYVAGAFAHYSGSTETTLGTDLNHLESSVDGAPFSHLLQGAQSPRAPGSRIASEDLKGKTVRSPYLRLLQLRAIQCKAHSWWSHRALDHGSTLPSLEVQVHHIFPKAWLRDRGLANHSETDTIANFAFLSKYDNTKISDRSPEQYLAQAQPDELIAQWVPQERSLWAPERFSEFCQKRRELLATALNEMLGLSGLPDTDTSEIPDETDEPELGAWAEELGRDPDAA